MNRLGRFALVALAVAGAAAFVLAGRGKQWDFETYYFAGAAYRSGLNPYSLADLTSVAHRTVTLPFLYPPVTLALFAPLSLLPKAIAAGAWTGLKTLVLGFLVWVWRRDFLRGIDPAQLIVLALLGFDLSAAWDLRTGNVALLEAALLWLAFASYVRDRVGLAAYLIALASMFKLLPIGLLALLALAPRPRRVRVAWIAGSGVLFLAGISCPAGLSAAWRSALLHASPNARLGIGINPSALGLADWLFSAGGLAPSIVPFAAVGAYLAFAATILLASVGPLERARASRSRVEEVVLVVLLWLLLAPRLMVYSFTMAIVPFVYILATRLPAIPWMALLILIPGLLRLVLPHPPAFLGVLSFALLLGCWALTIRRPSPDAPLLAASVPRSPAPAPR